MEGNKVRAKCPICEKIKMTTPRSEDQRAFEFTGHQKLPRLICSNCRWIKQAGKTAFQNSKTNQGIPLTRTKEPTYADKGISLKERQKQSNLVDFEIWKAHKNDPVQTVPAWINKLAITMR